MSDHSSSRAGPTRHRYQTMVAAVLLALAMVGIWFAYTWWKTPVIPTFALDRADPEVVVAVERSVIAVRRDPSSAATWGRLGLVLLANKLEAESIQPISEAAIRDQADPRWPYLRGVALAGRSPEEAIESFQEAVDCARGRGDADPQLLGAALLRLAETLAANGRQDEAVSIFRQVPDGVLSPCAKYGLGCLAAARGELDAAKSFLRECIDSPLTRRKARAQLAAVSRRMQEGGHTPPETGTADLPPDLSWPDPFLEECLTFLAGKERRTQRAGLLESQGRLQDALVVWREIARDYPDASSLAQLGILQGRCGQFLESEASLRKCLALEPQLLRAQHYLSLALFGQGERWMQQGDQTKATACFEESVAWSRKVTALAPNHGEAHFQLGLTFWTLKRPRESITAFRQAVANRPNLVDGYLWLARVLAETGETADAEQQVRLAARYARPDDPRPQRILESLRASASK